MPTPQRRRQQRLKFDHHESYLAWHFGIMVVTVGIIMSPIAPPGTTVPWATEKMLSICMAVGSGSALLGALIGTRFLLPDSVERPLDLRIPLGFTLFSTFATTVSIGVMEWITFKSVPGHHSNAQLMLQLGLGTAFMLMNLPLAVRAAHQIFVRTRLRNWIIDEVREE
jgi:hypothetical protein